MRQVLVLGGGVGGLAAAHRLRKRLAPEDRVVVFEQSPVHTFWPSLLWMLNGARHEGDVTRPLAALRDRSITVVPEAVTAIDPAACKVSTGSQTFTGDAMVVALGAELHPGAVPGLDSQPGNLYTVAGAEAVHAQLLDLNSGRVVVLIASVPFKCPAAPYEAAMLIDAFLRRRRRQGAVSVEVWAAEAAPMGVAGPIVSQSVVDALTERAIAYRPGRTVVSVAPDGRVLHFAGGEECACDVLAYVPPHRVPQVVADAGLAPQGGWVSVDRYTLETEFSNVFAIGDVTGIPLQMGKPLPKAGVFAHKQGEAVADTIASRLGRGGPEGRFSGVGECFVEMGGGIAGFARGNFYAAPVPQVHAYKPGRHWHAGKVVFERHWWAQWW